jgi:hypothetical protein
MPDAELTKTLHKYLPRLSVNLGRYRWTCIARMAGLRVGVNNAFRSAHRSRGDEKNLLNDIQGCAGEIIALLALELISSVGDVQHLALSFQDSGDSPDIKTTVNKQPFCAETKCLLMEPKKRLFLVNEAAHQKSVARGATHYIPVLTRIGCRCAVVGTPFPLADVEQWERKEFQYGDPARGMDLEPFCQKYFKLSSEYLTRSWEEWGDEIDGASQQQVAEAAVDRLDVIRRMDSRPWENMKVASLLARIHQSFAEPPL